MTIIQQLETDVCTFTAFMKNKLIEKAMHCFTEGGTEHPGNYLGAIFNF